MVASAQRITLFGNTANDNVPTGATPASGGIVVVSLSEDASAPTIIATGNTVKRNTAFGNSPVDLLWDQQGDNAFVANRCATSNPDGLCTGNGKHEHGSKDGGGEGGDNGRDHGLLATWMRLEKVRCPGEADNAAGTPGLGNR